jgi:lipid-binding SYLF domain-containing protein
VIIIPDEIAASFIVGYKRGTGAMFRRHGSDWSDASGRPGHRIYGRFKDC